MTAEFRDRWVLYLTAAERLMLIKALTLYGRAAAETRIESGLDRSATTPDDLVERLLAMPKLEKGVRPPHE